MRRDDLLPPAVKDLVDKLGDGSEPDFARDNVMTRLVAIEQACRMAIKSYKKSRSIPSTRLGKRLIDATKSARKGLSR